MAEHGHERLPRLRTGVGTLSPQHHEAAAARPEGAPASAAFYRPDRLARVAARRGHAAGLLPWHALVRRGRRGTAPRGHDGVHDAGPGPSLPRLQRAFPAPLGVHRPPVHERLALGRGRDLPAPPIGGRVRAVLANRASHRSAHRHRLGGDRRLFPASGGCCGNGEGRAAAGPAIRTASE